MEQDEESGGHPTEGEAPTESGQERRSAPQVEGLEAEKAGTAEGRNGRKEDGGGREAVTDIEVEEIEEVEDVTKDNRQKEKRGPHP